MTYLAPTSGEKQAHMRLSLVKADYASQVNLQVTRPRFLL